MYIKKNQLKPWLKKAWVIPPKANAEFVYRMEDILALYAEPLDPDRPVICMDETSKQLISEVLEPMPRQPGQPLKYDYQYRREGVCNLFMFTEPLAGQRTVLLRSRRTKADWVACLRWLLEGPYADVSLIRLVSDNLNTHQPAAFYECLPPEEAKRLLDRVEFHYTPLHASWLNIAEIELSVLSRQCLSRRISSEEMLRIEIDAWTIQRNQACRKVDWQFTTTDARIRLKRLYPSYSA